MSSVSNKVNPARNPKVDKSLNAIDDYLGPNYTKDYSPNGSVRLRSEDGTKQIRFDIDDFHGDAKGPHINIEEFVPKNRFPDDTKMKRITNEHVYVK